MKNEDRNKFTNFKSYLEHRSNRGKLFLYVQMKSRSLFFKVNIQPILMKNYPKMVSELGFTREKRVGESWSLGHPRSELLEKHDY